MREVRKETLAIGRLGRSADKEGKGHLYLQCNCHHHQIVIRIQLQMQMQMQGSHLFAMLLPSSSTPLLPSNYKCKANANARVTAICNANAITQIPLSCWAALCRFSWDPFDIITRGDFFGVQCVYTELII